MTPQEELDYRHPAFPGGTLFASTYERVFMQLADRGRSSNLVGDRWAEVCAERLQDGGACSTALRTLEAGTVGSTVLRLDDLPDVARKASAKGLQNPDFLLVSGSTIWAADAKFSVDTARSKQVSAEATSSLLDLDLTALAGVNGSGAVEDIRDGVFLAPDYPLTHRLLTDRRGPRRTTIKRHELRLIQITPAEYLAPLGYERLQTLFAGMDAVPIDRESSLLLASYYFRLARAAVGCWQAQHAPMLAHRMVDEPTDDQMIAQAQTYATVRSTAWGLVQRWNAAADVVRAQRLQIDQAASPRINGRELKTLIEREALAAGVMPPSVNLVRRRVGSWFRDQVLEEFGPLEPPLVAFDQVVGEIARFSRSLESRLEGETARILAEVLRDAPSVEALDSET